MALHFPADDPIFRLAASGDVRREFGAAY